LEMRPIEVDQEMTEYSSISSFDDVVIYCACRSGQYSLVLKQVGSYVDTGVIELKEVSPPMLRNWEDVGIKASIPEGTHIGVRISDENDLSWSFPVEGSLNLSR
ncbi:MAG: hypothetical protein U9R75_11770, partial [Candidatus Thermoplasmatota archaeon]|nr:hypothetical protein [Candidatus Thermoplasmatota archaeon]